MFKGIFSTSSRLSSVRSTILLVEFSAAMKPCTTLSLLRSESFSFFPTLEMPFSTVITPFWPSEREAR